MNKIILLLGYLSITLLYACNKKENYNHIVSTDKTKPDPPTQMTVQNDAGEATITYTLPDTKNLLLIKADYYINDVKKRQVSVSYYDNKIVVSGFKESKDYTVTLRAISRANVASDPVTVTVHPSRPPYLRAFDDLLLQSSFGGINGTILNKLKKPIGLVLLRFDATVNRMVPIDQYFSEDSLISRNARGYQSIPILFGICTVDPFGNSSDTITREITPLPEIQLDKKKFVVYGLPTDGPISWNVSGLWNGDNVTDGNNNAWRVAQATALPVIATFDLGASAKLSRYVIYLRGGQFAYTNENMSKWTIWGTNTPSPPDAVLPLGATRGAVAGVWTNLGAFTHPPKPSGLVGTATTDADKAFVNAGFEFEFSINNPPVRYLRLSAEQTFLNITQVIVREITVYGVYN